MIYIWLRRPTLKDTFSPLFIHVGAFFVFIIMEGGKGLFSCNVFCHFYFTCSREKGLLFTVFREISKKMNVQEFFYCLFIVKCQFHFKFFHADTPLYAPHYVLSNWYKRLVFLYFSILFLINCPCHNFYNLHSNQHHTHAPDTTSGIN